MYQQQAPPSRPFTPCASGDKTATAQAQGRFLVALGALSKTPGINPKG